MLIKTMFLAAAAAAAAPTVAQTASQHDHSQAGQAQQQPQEGQHQPAGYMGQCPMMQHGQGQSHGSGSMQHGQMMHHQMRNTPANPFAEAEMRMHQRMMATAGEGPDETWVRKMIEHHRGAVETARILLSNGRDRDAMRMARETIASQEREIAELQAWLRRHNEGPQ